jgi:hypothetical protein
MQPHRYGGKPTCETDQALGGNSNASHISIVNLLIITWNTDRRETWNGMLEKSAMGTDITQDKSCARILRWRRTVGFHENREFHYQLNNYKVNKTAPWWSWLFMTFVLFMAVNIWITSYSLVYACKRFIARHRYPKYGTSRFSINNGNHLQDYTLSSPKIIIKRLTLFVWAGVAQSVQCLTTDWTTGVLSPAEVKGFPLVSVSRPALRPTQLPIQWIPRVKRDRIVMLTTNPNLVPRSRMSRSCISSPLGACMAVAGDIFT